MAPFGLSRQSGWGLSASGGGYRGNSRGPLALAVVFLLVGAVAGFGIASLGGESEPVANTGADRIIGYQVTDMASAERSESGAVKAATALLVGLPALSVASPDQQQRVLDGVFAQDADPASRALLRGLLTENRNRLVGPNPVSSRPITAKILVLPASYRVRTIDDNNVTVQIWRQTIFLEATGAVLQSAWATDDVNLRWQNGWKVASVSQVVGPAPPVATETGQFSTYAEVQAVLNNAFAYHPSLAGRSGG